MDISSGISNISLGQNNKLVLWPNYPSNPVDRIRAVENYRQSSREIYKASAEEESEILKSQNNPKMSVYTDKAGIRAASAVPGALFDAFA